MVGQTVDHAADVLELVGVVDRAVEHVLVVGHAGLDSLGRLGDRGDEVVVRTGPGKDSRSCGAVLAGVEVARLGDRTRRCLDVGVVEDDDRRLAAELEVDPLDVGGRRAGDLHARAYRSGDGDHLGRLVLDEPAPGVAVAAHDVEHARRQELLGELSQQRGAGRRGVARLQDDGVARRQRRGDLPDHHHQRVVPRRDLADHADRLTPDVGGVVLHVLAGRLALEHPGGAGEEAEVVGGVRHLLRHRQAERLAGVLGLDRVDLLGPRVDRVGDLEQGGRSVLRCAVTPRLERLGRGGVRLVDVLVPGQRRGGVHLARRRVDDVVPLAGHAVDELAADDVLESLVSHAVSPQEAFSDGWEPSEGMRDIYRAATHGNLRHGYVETREPHFDPRRDGGSRRQVDTRGR